MRNAGAAEGKRRTRSWQHRPRGLALSHSIIALGTTIRASFGLHLAFSTGGVHKSRHRSRSRLLPPLRRRSPHVSRRYCAILKAFNCLLDVHYVKNGGVSRLSTPPIGPFTCKCLPPAWPTMIVHYLYPLRAKLSDLGHSSRLNLIVRLLLSPPALASCPS